MNEEEQRKRIEALKADKQFYLDKGIDYDTLLKVEEDILKSIIESGDENSK